MNMNVEYPIRKLIVLLIASMIVILPAVAVGENQTNVTNQTNATVTAASTVSQTATVTQTVKEEKFRVGPTVRIRPVNDVITKSEDGLVEIYFDNPTLNDVTLNADVHISVPSGVHVSGEGFGLGSAAGTLYGTFSVPPGTVRTVNIRIKAEKTGNFFADFQGMYWPGNDKDHYNPISLTHPFKVIDQPPTPVPTPVPTQPPRVPATSALTTLIIILVVFSLIVARR